MTYIDLPLDLLKLKADTDRAIENNGRFGPVFAEVQEAMNKDRVMSPNSQAFDLGLFAGMMNHELTRYGFPPIHLTVDQQGGLHVFNQRNGEVDPNTLQEKPLAAPNPSPEKSVVAPNNPFDPAVMERQLSILPHPRSEVLNGDKSLRPDGGVRETYPNGGLADYDRFKRLTHIHSADGQDCHLYYRDDSATMPQYVMSAGHYMQMDPGGRYYIDRMQNDEPAAVAIQHGAIEIDGVQRNFVIDVNHTETIQKVYDRHLGVWIEPTRRGCF